MEAGNYHSAARATQQLIDIGGYAAPKQTVSQSASVVRTIDTSRARRVLAERKQREVIEAKATTKT